MYCSVFFARFSFFLISSHFLFQNFFFSLLFWCTVLPLSEKKVKKDDLALKIGLVLKCPISPGWGRDTNLWQRTLANKQQFSRLVIFSLFFVFRNFACVGLSRVVRDKCSIFGFQHTHSRPTQNWADGGDGDSAVSSSLHGTSFRLAQKYLGTLKPAV